MDRLPLLAILPDRSENSSEVEDSPAWDSAPEERIQLVGGYPHLKTCDYRLLRCFPGKETYVAYVHVANSDVLPEGDNERYYPQFVLRNLRKIIDVWNEPWTTLTLDKKGDETWWEVDQWEPYCLPDDFSYLDLPHVELIRISGCGDNNFVKLKYIEFDGKEAVLKYGGLWDRIDGIQREIEAYHTLTRQGFTLIPRLLAYTYERTENEVVGFVSEKLEGRPAGPEDYEACRQAIIQLHSHGALHGDINRNNFVITENGPHFIDLETVVFEANTDWGSFSRRQQQELDELLPRLNRDPRYGLGAPLGDQPLMQSELDQLAHLPKVKAENPELWTFLDRFDHPLPKDRRDEKFEDQRTD